jgi:adenine-specific DNA methylase
MIPKGCKRLVEVDFPIAEVSRHAAREKSIRHGHPRTLHLWWARRPLASSRAVLLGLLWPDPCDRLCPTEFKEQARRLLPRVGACNPGTTDEDLRKAMLRFIGDFANWNNASNRTYLDVSRALVKAAHGEEPPLVVDPFAGGGSIPLEALRLGCDAFASDLNPVACLILKVMLEDIPRHGPKLAEELRLVGAEIKRQAEKELADLYPKDPDGAAPIAYLWARTVRCESPNCGAEIPLLRSLWLCKKPTRRRALRLIVRSGQPPTVHVEIIEPTSEMNAAGGTVTLGRATCPACSTALPRERIRSQLTDRRFGANDARLVAVVCVSPEARGRLYRSATARDLDAVASARERLAQLELDPAISELVPTEPIPKRNTRNSGFGPVLYGATTWRDLFSDRQLLSMTVLTRLIASRSIAFAESSLDGAVCRLLAFALSKSADFNSSVSRWASHMEKSVATFGRQAIPILWDWGEVVPIGDSTGAFTVALDWIATAVSRISGSISVTGNAELLDAATPSLPQESASVWFTDPPYYDAIAYSDLSDYFFVWLKRALPRAELLRSPFLENSGLTPKAEECVENVEFVRDGIPEGRAFFESKLGTAFHAGRKSLRDDGVGCVVFAHKTTEGWEALLSALHKGGWIITASWPVATEKGSRLVAQNTAALATSVHLICRPRADKASVGDWAEVLRELPPRVGDWMERLQREGVRGADLVFACIGPALEIFSRYAKVETADGREVALAEYLEKVWEVVGRSALAQVLGTAEAKARNGAAGAVEEDARLTALFLWTLQSTAPSTKLGAGGEGADAASDEDEDPSDEDDDEEGSSRGKAKGFTLVFDVVRRFAQPLGIDLPKWEGRVIETKKGVVRLLPIAERATQLFGEDGAQAVAARLEQDVAVSTNPLQWMLFPDLAAAPKARARGRGRGTRGGIDVSDDSLAAAREATTLDRVHAAMLLQAGGRTNALRALLKAEQERGPDFLRLANAFSALYPKGSEEKRLLDAMLLAVPR